jgi:hypothetical protein
MSLQSAGTPIVLSKTEAAMSGLSRFCTGRECKCGHLAQRYVSNGQCVICNAEKARARERLRGQQEPSYRMFRNTLRRTGMALSGRASASVALACDHERLREHISTRFREGMTWDRYRQWEVDHVEPLSSARSERELLELCHYTNLQPLWRRENRIKGGA